MEILQSDDKLREEILKDAKTKADRIIKKAEKEAEDINKNVEKDIEGLKKDYEKTILGEAENIIKLTLASVDIEVKKEITSFCGKIVDEVFDEIKESILNDKTFKYRDVMLKLIQDAVEKINSDNYIIEINNDELKRLDKKELQNLKLKKGKIKEISISDIKNGLMLYSEDRKLVSQISIEKYIDSLKSRTRNDAYRMIIKGS